MREIWTSGSIRRMLKRCNSSTTKAPPDERGGNRYVLPKATALHLDSTALRTQVRHRARSETLHKTRSLQRLGSCSARNVKRASPLGERASEANVHVIRPFGSPLPLQSLHFPRFALHCSRILGGPME